MTALNTSLEIIARENLINVCCQQKAQGLPNLHETGEVCPALWLLRDLVNLLEEFHDRPMEDLAPMIRRMLLEQNFVDENGDSVFDLHAQAQVDAEVDLILHALDHTRKQAQQMGVWAGVGHCTQWFG